MEKTWVAFACSTMHDGIVTWKATGRTHGEAEEAFKKVVRLYITDRANFPELTDAEWEESMAGDPNDPDAGTSVEGFLFNCSEHLHVELVDKPWVCALVNYYDETILALGTGEDAKSALSDMNFKLSRRHDLNFDERPMLRLIHPFSI